MYLTRRFYISVVAIVLALIAAHFVPQLLPVAHVALALLFAIVLVDIGLLYHKRRPVSGERLMADRFSNGDDNDVTINLQSEYPFKTRVEVIDEAPHVFQRRDIVFRLTIDAHSGGMVRYTLRPTRRGSYGFGLTRVFVATALGLVQRRLSLMQPVDVKVYPSYLMLNKYELMAMSNNLTDVGIKRIRRVGNHTEFEQIKEYVQGDEYRSINWKASARRASLMVNVYQDERSQQVFNVIDTGRSMQQAFEQMTLLDYAINATLVLSHIAIRRGDKAGVVTFAGTFDTYVPEGARGSHMMTINETLYDLEASDDDSDFASLVLNVDRLIGKRSLLVLYTNFTTPDSMRRQLPYLRRLNNRHRLLVVIFDDVEIEQLATQAPTDIRGYYTRVIAGQYVNGKRAIASELRQNGIYTLLTAPAKLSVNIINKYLEMKARQLF